VNVPARVCSKATIILGTSTVIDCVVRDLTNVGARIEIQNTVDLPEAVDITFDGGHTFRPCRLIWRTSNETGLEFFEPPRRQS